MGNNDRIDSKENLKQTLTGLKSEIDSLNLEIKENQSQLEGYRSIFENSQDATLILINREFIDANNAAVELLEYPDKERLLNTTPSLLSPVLQEDGKESTEKSHKMMDLAVLHGSYRFEWTHLKFDGSPILIEVLLTKVRTGTEDEIIYTILRDLSERKNAREISRKNEERFRALVESTSDFIWEVDRKVRYTYASPKVKEILGYTPSEMIGKAPFDFMPESIKGQIMEQFSVIAENKRHFQNLENVNFRKDGTRVVLETSGVPFFDNQGELAGYRGIDRDITIRKLNEEQLILSENVFTNSIEGIVITSPDGTIQKVNKAFTDITGYSEEEALGENPRILKSDRNEDKFYTKMWLDLKTTGQWSDEIWNRKKDGSIYPEWLSISAIRDDDGEITNYISLFHDISEKKINEEQLEFLAFHDSLTKLPNRQLFYDRLNFSIQTSIRTGNKLALLYMDIDNFKNINDSYGHPFGDELLCHVKDRISAICRSSDTFARYGGDEFVIVLNQLKNSQEALDFSIKIVNLFKTPLSILEEEIFTSLSIGLAIFPDDGKNIITLEKNADLALYKAKREGKGQVYAYRKELKDSFQRKTFLINNLRQAVDNFSSFTIVYQPKVDANDKTIKGVEALLRWKQEGNWISPEEFIPIAEDTNLIIPLGDWILQQAMSDMKVVHDSGYTDIAFSINLSTRQFINANLYRTIEKLTAELGINRSKLFLEITETAPMNNVEEAIEIMEKFNQIEISFSMDDFGTGHSSLSNLKRFPLKELKIDRSFIMDIPEDKNDMAISKTIISIGKTLNCQIVAEGVETESQLAFLKEQGCNMIQGYLFYKPLLLDELLKALKNPVDL